jgi:peptide/nickel transport system substrate-binding protein
MSLPTRTRILSAGLTALAIGVVAACSGPATPAGTGTSTGAATSSGSGVDTLVIANAVKVDTLDPEANSVNESIWLDQNLYSRLLQPNATGTALLPDLATSWDIAANGLSYTFHLRPDAQFADGSPVTASDVVYSIERSRKFSGGWGFLLTAVKAITAPDPHTVVVTLSQPHAPLLADLAMYAYSVVPEKLVKAQGAAFFQHPVGSGPFMVTSFSADSEVDLARNPHFYGIKPKISKVKMLIVPDEERDREAGLPGPRDPRRLVHAVQDGVLQLRAAALSVRPGQGQAVAGPGRLPARLQHVPDHGQR